MLSSQGVAPIGAGEKVDAINTNGQPQLEGTEQKTQQVALVTNLDIKQMRGPLKQDVANLTEEIQCRFQKLSDATSNRIEAFLGQIKVDNEAYRKENLSDDQVRGKYRSVRETDQASHQEITSSYEKTKTLFQNRIKALQEVIAKHSLEKALLKERTEGKSSIWQSLSWSQRYGAEYRLWETAEALKKRSGAPLGGSLLESAMVEESMPVRTEMANLLLQFEVLKEEITIYNEALSEVSKTALPLLHFQRHTQAYKNLIEQWNKLKEDQQNRLKALKEKIVNIESSKEEKHLLPSLQKEKLELAYHYKAIIKHAKEIAALLLMRQDQFSLKMDSTPEEMIEYPVLSNEDTKSQEILKWSVELKEKSASHNWEKYSSVSTKYYSFSEATRQKNELDNEYNTFKIEAYPERVKHLETALASYQSYIQTMGREEKKINHQLKALNRAIQERTKWQIDPPVETDEKEKDAKTENSAQPSSWWTNWLSNSPAKPKKDEVKQESIAEGEAKTDEPVENEGEKEAGKEDEVKVKEEAPATSNT